MRSYWDPFQNKFSWHINNTIYIDLDSMSWCQSEERAVCANMQNVLSTFDEFTEGQQDHMDQSLKPADEERAWTATR